MTEKEKIEKAKKEKVILHGNTRLAKTPWKSESQEEKIRKAVENREAMEAGKVGVDGKEITRPETPSVNGFKLMSMAPSPALGVEVNQSNQDITMSSPHCDHTGLPADDVG